MVTATAVADDRGAAALRSAPVRRLTVLYDAQCALCAFVRNWLAKQRQLVPLDLVPVGSAEARRRFPGLDHAAAYEEITVVGDGGQVYRGASAWVVCLWALSAYRPLAHRISTPSGIRFARGAVLAAAKYRGARWQVPAAGASGWVYQPAGGWTYVSPPACDGGGCGAQDA
ncbi:thiol-disulfide oxidoreductase DCC family protein [Streptomyces klenkii]